MALQLNPYLSFQSNAREAMEFYRSVFGGSLDVRTFKDFHASKEPAEDELVMHSVLETDDFTIMASDTPRRIEYKPGSNFNLSLSGDDEPRLRGYFNKLCEGGTITMPLEKALWGDTFGMCVDKFGIQWLVNISPGDQ